MPGYTLHMLSHRSQVAFDPLSAETPSRLLTIGKIIAADISINNPDRVPSMRWKEGNSGNLMIEIEGNVNEDEYRDPYYNEMKFSSDVVAIDNKCFPVLTS